MSRDYHGSSTATHHTLKLLKGDEYTSKLKPALDALAALDANPSDLLEMLFSKEELEWLKTQYTSH